MKFSPGNAQHIGARSEQQDAFGFSDHSQTSFVAHGGVVAVIADGMGGLAHGSEASHTAVSAFLKAYQSKAQDEAIPDALLRSIHTANEAVAALAHAAGTKNGLGTTLAAAVMHDQSLYWISAGDSRVYFHREGHLTCLTADHTYAADLSEQVDKGEITQAAALTHPERASLTSYLGLDTLPKVERSLRPFPVQPGDCTLICSDGLYRALSEEEIAAGLQNESSQICDVLVQRALAKGIPAQDNITVLTLKCHSDSQRLVRVNRSLAMLGLIAGIALIAAVALAYAWIFFRRNSLPPKATGAHAEVIRQSGGTPVHPPADTSQNLPARSVLLTVGPFTSQATNVRPKGATNVSWLVKGATGCGVSIKSGDGSTVVDEDLPAQKREKGNSHGAPPNGQTSYTLFVNCPNGNTNSRKTDGHSSGK